MVTWLKSIDDSFDPIDDYAAAYAAKVRVWFRYAGPGSAGKHWTAHEMAMWHAQGPDTFCGFLAEGMGDEAITNPAIGDDHARSALAAMRALDLPVPHLLCAPAVDRNINVSQTRGPVTQYMRNWIAGYGGLPVVYVEVENGGRLVAEGVSAGTFTPAAYLWGEAGVLITPANAPSHVVQTQEQNGRKFAGGTVDFGHVRSDAPHVWWSRPGAAHGSVPVGSGEELDVTNAVDVWQGSDVDVIEPSTSITTAANRTWQPKGAIEWLVNHVDSTETKVEKLATAVTALAGLVGKGVDVKALAAELVALMPADPLNEDELATAIAAAIVKLAAGTPAPAAV